MNQIIDKLGWILIRDGKLLTVRSKDKTLFYVPDGKRALGESDEQALVREIKEELSVDLVTSSIQYMETFTAQADGKEQGVTVKLTCYAADYVGELKPDAEIEELRFVDHNDAADCSLATQLALQWLHKNSSLTK